MSLTDISNFISGGHFVQQRGTICANLVEGIMRIKFGSRVQEMFKDISNFSSGGHYVRQSRTIRAI